MSKTVSASIAASLVHRHERVVRRRLARGDIPTAHKDASGVWQIDPEALTRVHGWTLDRERLVALDGPGADPSHLVALLEQLHAALRAQREQTQALAHRLDQMEQRLRALRTQRPREAIGDGSSDGSSDGSAHIGLSPDARHILSDPTPPRPRRAAPTLRLGAGLPDELVSVAAFCAAHAIAETTVKKAIVTGRLSGAQRGRWKQGRVYVAWALDADGRSAFYALYGDRPDFQRCPSCPH